MQNWILPILTIFSLSLNAQSQEPGAKAAAVTLTEDDMVKKSLLPIAEQDKSSEEEIGNMRCADVATFSDRPGAEYLIFVRSDNSHAIVMQRPVKLRGPSKRKPWTLLAPLLGFRVEVRDDGKFITENTKKVDWTKTEDAQVSTQYTFFKITKDKYENGSLKGEVTHGGMIEKNPNKKEPEQPFPLIGQAQPTEVGCHKY
jgi:hypothetical protein